MLLAEIAAKAQVSPATVSRAINQPSIVAPASLARIQAVMKQYNYLPSPSDRRRGPKLSKPNLKKIGVWFVGANARNHNFNWFQDQLLQIQSLSPRYRVDLRVLFSSSETQLPDGLFEANLDGLIIQGLEPTPECMAKLGDMPRVWFMTRRSVTVPCDFVEPNNEENAQSAAEYLKRLGHKSVAVVSVNPDYSAIERRIDAFTSHAKKLGLQTHAILGESTGAGFLQLEPIHQESSALVRRLLAIKPKPTGLYIPSDHFCGSFFRALRAAGCESGRDFDAILGNFNPTIYHNLDHSPAAIDINLSTLVGKVIDHLLWRIENPQSVGRVGIYVSPTLRAAEHA